MGLVVPLNSCILDELPELLGGPAGLDPDREGHLWTEAPAGGNSARLGGWWNR